MSPDNDRADPARPGVLRRIGRAALSPWLSLRISERVATLRRDLDEFRSATAGLRRGFASMRRGGSISRPWRSCMGRGAGHSRKLWRAGGGRRRAMRGFFSASG